MRDRFFWGLGRVDQCSCHGEADRLLRCFYFTVFHAALKMRSNEKKSIRQSFEFLLTAMMLSTPQGAMRVVVVVMGGSHSRKTNCSWKIRSNFSHLYVLRWNMKLIFQQVRHLDQILQLTNVFRISIPSSQRRWTPSCPAVWGSACIQTGCLSEALTSSALITLTGPGWLPVSPFFSAQSSLRLIWRLVVRSFQPTTVKIDIGGKWELFLFVCYLTSSKSDTTGQRLIMFL